MSRVSTRWKLHQVLIRSRPSIAYKFLTVKTTRVRWTIQCPWLGMVKSRCRYAGWVPGKKSGARVDGTKICFQLVVTCLFLHTEDGHFVRHVDESYDHYDGDGARACTRRVELKKMKSRRR